jgi:hypothetical protein
VVWALLPEVETSRFAPFNWKTTFDGALPAQSTVAVNVLITSTPSTKTPW